MSRSESVELTVLCLLHTKEKYLLQDLISTDWQGYTLPGGHIEEGESIVDAVVREMREETGLTIKSPKLCGVKQFPLKDDDYSSGRYLVFLFEATDFEGELKSSEEGEMHWVEKSELFRVNLVADFADLIDVMTSDKYSEFQYIVNGDDWQVVKK